VVWLFKSFLEYQFSMKIIIAGAGEVGYHLASMLADEEQDIYLVDRNEDRLNYI
jgi:trk system potassium uptake protein TrkA